MKERNKEKLLIILDFHLKLEQVEKKADLQALLVVMEIFRH